LELAVRGPRLRLILLGIAIVVVSLIGYRTWPRQDVVSGYAYPVPPHNSDNTVEVLNGTDRRGLARRGTRALRASGFDVVFFGNADPKVDSTTILIRRGSETIGQRLQAALGAGTVTVEPDSLRYVDATVILGMDYTPPAPLDP